MRTISVQIKQIGKKYPSVAPKNISLHTDKDEVSLAEFISLVVENQVEQFNAQKRNFDEDGIPQTLQTEYLDILTQVGKAGFGGVYNPSTADMQQAKENAIQCFEDGMYAVFCEEKQLEDLAEIVSLQDVPSFTFIRLTFLAGSIW